MSQPKRASHAARIKTRFNEIAYQSDVTGQWEIYVCEWPGLGNREQVSIDGGTGAVWNPRGGEIFFHGPNGLMVASIDNGKTVRRELLFAVSPSNQVDFDVTRDGQRFLFVDVLPQTEFRVATHWFEELRARAPLRR